MAKIIMIFTIIVLLFSFYTTPIYASVRVEPSRFIFNLDAGYRTTGAITVTNNTERVLDLYANYYDWDLDEEETMNIYETGTLKYSLDGLLRFNPRNFTLEPGQTQLVRFTVSLPEVNDENITQLEKRGIIFFEQEEYIETEEAIGTFVRSMIGTTIYVVPTVYEERVLLLQSMVYQPAEEVNIGALLVRNDGVAHFRSKLEFEVIDKYGNIIEKGEVPEIVILPEQDRAIFFELESNFLPGEYELIVLFKPVGVSEEIIHNIYFSIN